MDSFVVQVALYQLTQWGHLFLKGGLLPIQPTLPASAYHSVQSLERTRLLRRCLRGDRRCGSGFLPSYSMSRRWIPAGIPLPRTSGPISSHKSGSFWQVSAFHFFQEIVSFPSWGLVQRRDTQVIGASQIPRWGWDGIKDNLDKTM